MLQQPGRVPMIPPELKPSVEAELQPGEKVVWFGQPSPSAMSGCAKIIPVLFGIIFTGFAVFWTVGATFAGSHAGPLGMLFGLFGLPFIIAGLFVMTLPLWTRKKLAKTLYLLTDRRAVIIDPGFFRGVTVHSYRPDRLTSLTRTERPDGSGDLVFEQFTTHHGSGHSTTRRGFLAIANVREVEALVNQLADSVRQSRQGPPTLPG